MLKSGEEKRVNSREGCNIREGRKCGLFGEQVPSSFLTEKGASVMKQWENNASRLPRVPKVRRTAALHFGSQ